MDEQSGHTITRHQISMLKADCGRVSPLADVFAFILTLAMSTDCSVSLSVCDRTVCLSTQVGVWLVDESSKQQAPIIASSTTAIHCQ